MKEKNKVDKGEERIGREFITN